MHKIYGYETMAEEDQTFRSNKAQSLIVSKLIPGKNDFQRIQFHSDGNFLVNFHW